jgi:hypothetical protein
VRGGVAVLELVFEVLIYTVPQATGRAVVYAVTLGRVRCEDGTAEVIGIGFWLLVALAVMLIATRR